MMRRAIVACHCFLYAKACMLYIYLAITVMCLSHYDQMLRPPMFFICQSLSGTSWNQLEQTETRWSYSRLAQERVRVVSCIGSCKMLPCIRQEIWGNLTIIQTHRASKDMEIWVNSLSWRSTKPSEFLLNKLILICFGLVNGQ